MITINLTNKPFWENNVEGYVLFMNKNFETASDISDLDVIEKDYYPHVKKILKRHNFTGEKEQSYVLTAVKDEKLIQFIFVGIGAGDKAWDKELEILRLSLG